MGYIYILRTIFRLHVQPIYILKFSSLYSIFYIAGTRDGSKFDFKNPGFNNHVEDLHLKCHRYTNTKFKKKFISLKKKKHKIYHREH